ncbi:nitroreductase family protein [Brevibacillus fluminis]|uniref:nitroreductase family protein n=1 Tax=Brevibacillus fluminis TaxID=511487 RepID=UPI003F8A60B8
MEVLEAIKTRRSIGKVKQDAVEKEKIEQILEAGTWAPNHRHTEPWKFFVMTGEGRKHLGEAYAEIAREELSDPDSEEGKQSLRKQYDKAFRAPVVIAVAVTPNQDPQIVPLEEIGAVNAAIQNMLLAAHDLSLGAVWRTGLPAYHPRMKQAFGLQENDEVLGLLYIGYPDMPVPKASRASIADKTVWLDN